MPAVKSLDRSAAKWIRQASTSGPEYEAGIQNPRRSWMEATSAAESNYEQGVNKAIASKRFGKGVAKAGDAKWKKNSLEKGPRRWIEGISVSEEAYKRGFAPYRTALEGLTLPARGPKGDPKNINRVAAVAKKLHDTKLELAGG